MNVALLSRPKYVRDADAAFASYRARVLADSGTIETPFEIQRELRRLAQLNLLDDDLTLAYIAGAYKAGLWYNIKGASGDLDVVRATNGTRRSRAGLIDTLGNNLTRADFDAGVLKGNWVESSATNLLQRSEEFDNAYWTKQDVTIASNATTAPDGTITADKLQETATSAFHRVSRAIDVSAGANTISVYAKKSERNFLVIRSNLPDANVNTTFNLDTGVITFNGHSSASIEALPNGWYRCSASAVSTAKSTTFGYLTSNVDVANNTIPSYLGVTGSGIFIWGAQLETGSTASTYIKTTGSTATRNADNISKTGISGLIGQTEGVIYAEVDIRLNSIGNRRILVIDNGAETSSTYLRLNNENRVQLISFNTTLQSQIQTATNQQGKIRVACVYGQDNFKLFVNGALIGSDTSGTIPASRPNIRVGLSDQVAVASHYLADPIKTAYHWKATKTDAQLIQLTTL